MEIKRREFLRLFGGFTAGATVLGGCMLDEVYNMPENLLATARGGAGVETWQNTVCGLCPGGCGMRVRLVDGVPVYVKGNALHPVNQGGMCPLGLNALHHLYHPDRLTSPLKRVGKPGEGKWQPITWDEATATVADALRKLRDEGRAHELVVLGHADSGIMSDHIDRFLRAYGSPNYYQFSSINHDGVPYALMHGHAQIPAFDLLNARLVLSFGANFLEDGYSPIYYTRLFSQHRERQTRYVQIEPRMSLTAANADEWIPIQPGTYGALALGLAYVLIREELYDKDFVQSSTFGFDDWIDNAGTKHIGFKSIVLGNYYPERVSEISGVPSAVILEMARAIGRSRPAVALAGPAVASNTNGTYAVMAIQSLNALLGNFQREGGVYFVDPPPYGDLPAVREDEAARIGNRQPPVADSVDGSPPSANASVESLITNVLAGRPYPVSVLFHHHGNPLFEAVNHLEFASALKKIPLVVSFDSIINETSEYAHLILPEPTFLERWDAVANVPSVGFAHAGIQHPVVKPFYDTRSAGDVLIACARRIGGAVGEAFPLDSYEETVKRRMHGIYASGEGTIFSGETQHMWLDYLQRRGWQAERYGSFDEFWAQLVERGGWWNPARPAKASKALFRTPTGKFEFYSHKLRETVSTLTARMAKEDAAHNLELALTRLNITARGDAVFLPHHEPVPYEGDMPLHLTVFQVLPNRDGAGAHLPMMQEMAGYATRRFWKTWVEIHPETAAQYGIADEAWVWLESSLGSIRVQAKVTPSVSPNVVGVPFGLGHTSYGRYARGHGANPHTILRNLQDRISGKPALEATKVRISLAS